MRGSIELHGRRADCSVHFLAVTPLQSDPASDDKWLDVITHVDAIVDALGGSAPISDLSSQLIKKTEQAISKRHPTAGQLTYIWTSGYLLHNDDRFFSQSEQTPALNPPSKVSWRPAVEKQLTSSDKLKGIVVRPPLIYGSSGSVTALIFKQFAQEGNNKITWPGSPGLRWPTAHVDDVGQAFRLALEKSDIVKGLIIDIANPQTESIDTLLNHLAALTKRPADSWSYREPGAPIEEALSRTVIVRADRATHLLGWRPQKLGLIDGLPGYYETFKSFL